jgi:hypothetical protein
MEQTSVHDFVDYVMESTECEPGGQLFRLFKAGPEVLTGVNRHRRSGDHVSRSCCLSSLRISASGFLESCVFNI